MAGRGVGRGRARSQDPKEVEAAYEEYVRKCQELAAERSPNSSRSSTSSANEASSSSASPVDSVHRFISTGSQMLGVGRGRGRGRSANSIFNQPLPPGLHPDNPTYSSSSGSHHTPSSSISSEDDLVSSFRSLDPTLGNTSLGRGRSAFPPEEPGPGNVTVVPIPTVGTSTRVMRSIGRGNSTFWKEHHSSTASFQPREPPQVGVEDFSEVEKEVVVRKGATGLSVALTANFIQLSVDEGRGLFEYHVDFDPTLESVRTRRWILTNHEDQLGKVKTFDGAKLYLPFELPEKKTVLQSQNPNDYNQMITITIRFVKKNLMGESVHFYNVLLRRIMEKLGMLEVNRNFYDYRSRYALPQHLMEIWPGYVTAVDEMEGGLMLCCDVSHRVLRTSTLLNVYNDMHFEARGNIERHKALFSEYAIGQIILTRYNNKNYRVDDIAWDQNPKSTFQLGNGEWISYKDYYKRQYDITITDLEQPLLINRPKPKQESGGRRRVLELVCLIPECAHMTGLTSELTNNRKVMQDVAKYTRVEPNQRRLALVQYIKNIKDNVEAKDILDSWGLKIEDATIELPGRMLKAPDIILNQNVVLSGKNDFGSDLCHSPCLEPIAVRDWMIFFASSDKGSAATFVQTYKSVCRNIGIEVSSDPKFVPVHGQRNRIVENYALSIKENLQGIKNVQFVVIIVPAEIGELYSAIKRICCLEMPIPSQVLLSKTLANQKLRPIVAKVALQINCKLGGALWTIRIPLVEKIMFVGMDVYHDPKKRSPSILALVASLNAAQTKYFSRIVSQRSHQELGDSLRSIFMDSLHAYKRECGKFPDRIVVFRDGVGDGQLELTKDIEVVQMMGILNLLYETEVPKFTFVIVQKRISCRLFAAVPDSYPTRYVNPPPGTVLDNTVTRRYLYDFFLVSQLVRQGTVSPTHYIVLEDNRKIAPDLIQKFAFATSFLYYNWAGPIRVPAVCQYAHKLAFLVGQYIRDVPSDMLSSQLYYL